MVLAASFFLGPSYSSGSEVKKHEGEEVWLRDCVISQSASQAVQGALFNTQATREIVEDMKFLCKSRQYFLVCWEIVLE